HHPGAAAVGGVVDGPVPVGRPRPQVVQVHVEQAALDRLAQQRDAQRPGQVVREDGDHVDPHRSNNPSGGSTTTRSPGTSTAGTSSRTNRTGGPRPPASPTR